jgi:hypothetical protein
MTVNVFGGGYNPLAPVFPVQRSVRLRSSASAYFNRTFGTPTDSTKFTWSAWVKRGALNAVRQGLIGRYIDGNNLFRLFFDTNDTLILNDTQAASTKCNVVTNAVFRDPSAWYHILVAIDTANGTAANRQIIYVNGVQQTFSSATNYSATSLFNVASAANTLGLTTDVGPTNRYFDGYLTEINFIDGQALTPSSFGSYNAGSGVWQPIRYSGTYGTNGFYLNFQDNSAATAAAIGKDSSGNGNNWTPNNISVTAGVTYDSMLDVPTLTSATNANYATLNPIAYSQYSSLTDGNLALLTSVSLTGGTNGTIGVNSGKWYWEITVGATGTPSQTIVGIRNQSANVTATSTGYPGGDSSGYGYYANSGQKYTGGTGSAYGATYTSGDVIGVAFDADSATLTFYKNNTSQGVAFSSISMVNNSWFPAFGDGSTGSQSLQTVNFGQRPFTYTPPTGFVALNTYNLPAPTIPNGATQFAATTYTGTGASLAIANTVNSVSFQPDFVWVKGRSGATDHALYDSVRGTTKQLESNTTTAETTEATGLTAFGTGGFTVGALAQMNTNTATYVGWQWRASNAAAVTNTSGSISSQVSANPSAGFSIVTYTGTGANATVGHGLGIAPSMIIAKTRGTTGDWAVYHASLGATKGLYLNQTAAAVTSAGFWNNTAPTSSVLTIATGATTSLLYCFSEIAGYSKFGSYTGNGSADGPFIYTGFRPRWLLLKNTGGVASWYCLDSSRNTYNVVNSVLVPNSSQAEVAITSVDFLSNGFKLRTTTTDINGSGTTYIYAAFAESPFNYSLAR